ncbi:hypothetical protein MBLNU459_g0544t1 [Dothideomycetes sp. NU459]
MSNPELAGRCREYTPDEQMSESDRKLGPSALAKRALATPPATEKPGKKIKIESTVHGCDTNRSVEADRLIKQCESLALVIGEAAEDVAEVIRLHMDTLGKPSQRLTGRDYDFQKGHEQLCEAIMYKLLGTQDAIQALVDHVKEAQEGAEAERT